MYVVCMCVCVCLVQLYQSYLRSSDGPHGLYLGLFRHKT